MANEHRMTNYLTGQHFSWGAGGDEACPQYARSWLDNCQNIMQTLLWRHMTTYVVLCSLDRGSRQANSKRFQSPFLAQESLEQ